MFGLKRHRPPLVVFAVTEGGFPGYSVLISSLLYLYMAFWGPTFRKFDAEL